MKYLLDTDTLIYIYKRAGNCMARLSAQPDSDMALSSVNLFELEFGMAKSARRALMERYVQELCKRYTVLNFDPDAARQAGVLRAHRPQRHPDRGPRVGHGLHAGDPQRGRVLARAGAAGGKLAG